MEFGVSVLGKRIYAGRSKQVNGYPKLKEWIGKKEDVTDKVIAAVFEYMMEMAKDGDSKAIYQIKYKGQPATLTMDLTGESWDA